MGEFFMTTVRLPGKRHKYNVGSIEKRTINGKVFDSIAEARRYSELHLLEKSGAIHSLEHHKVFNLYVNGMCVARYESDFSYIDCKTGEQVIEDVKGVRTPEYKIKRNLMLAIYGIRIQEINA